MTEAKQRWVENLPVNLAQLAEAQGISYESARTLAKMPGFPKLGRLIWPEDFLRWRKTLVVKRDRPTRQDHQAEPAGKSGGSRSKHDSPSAWPQRAARLRAQVA
jgi:hypothetical protein